MPIYEYVCEHDHVTEQKGGYDDEMIPCPEVVLYVEVSGDPLLGTCDMPAHRRPGYISQGVIFKGTGFTKTVIPPSPPKPTTKAGEPVNDWAEKTDTYVRESYTDDKNYRDERKQQAREMLEQVGKGGIA